MMKAINRKKYHQLQLESLELLPTQSVVGDLEVRHKIGIIQDFKRKRDLISYMKKHIIPTVIGPRDKVYIVDHHHFVKAVMQTRCSPFVYATCIINLNHLSISDFWHYMVKNNLVYLKDKYGDTIPPRRLPKTMFQLDNDPYRSLAWMTREYGGYDKVHVPFSEFIWANFLRKHVDIHAKDHHLHHALLKSLKLAKSSRAKHLPGFKGKKKK
jgi:hypothetical protein